MYVQMLVSACKGDCADVANATPHKKRSSSEQQPQPPKNNNNNIYISQQNVGKRIVYRSDFLAQSWQFRKCRPAVRASSTSRSSVLLLLLLLFNRGRQQLKKCLHHIVLVFSKDLFFRPVNNIFNYNYTLIITNIIVKNKQKKTKQVSAVIKKLYREMLRHSPFKGRAVFF